MSQVDNNPQIKPKPKLLDQVRNVLRAKYYKLNTEKSYLYLFREYILPDKSGFSTFTTNVIQLKCEKLKLASS